MRILRPAVIFKAVVILACFYAGLFLSCSGGNALSAEFDLAAYTRTDGNRHIIHLPAGVYEVSKTIVLSSNTILEGEGDDTVLRAASGFRYPRFITNRNFRSGNSNITLRSFRVEISMPGVPADPVNKAPGLLRFENVENIVMDKLTVIVDSPMYGIDLSSHNRNVTVKNSMITNKGSGGGVMVRNREPLPGRGTSHVLIRKNSIKSTRDEPLAVFGWQGVVENVRIENNIIDARGASFGITVYGIDSLRHSGTIKNVKVTGNSVRGSRFGGIGVKGGAEGVDVLDNMVVKTEGDGIFIHTGGKGLPGVRNVRVRQNRVIDAGRHGIFAAGTEIKVERNKVEGCSQSGVYAIVGVTVANNKISDAKPGMIIEGNGKGRVSDNVLVNSGRILFLEE